MVNEEEIDNMSYLFFEDVLEALGHKLTYDAIVNYAGNSFCEKAWEMISEHNPLFADTDGRGKASTMNALASFFNSADIKTKK